MTPQEAVYLLTAVVPTPTPTPSGTTGPPAPDFWSFSNWATVIAATIAFLAAAAGVIATTMGVLQKWHSDRRDQWWKRVQWALEKSDETKDPILAAASLKLMEALQTHQLAHADDKAMLVNAQAAMLQARPVPPVAPAQQIPPQPGV